MNNKKLHLILAIGSAFAALICLASGTVVSVPFACMNGVFAYINYKNYKAL